MEKTYPTNVAIDILEEMGIKTLADLDAYRMARPSQDGTIDSRYGWLCRLVGVDAADGLTNALMVRQCF